MSKHNRNERLACRYFVWRLVRRDAMWQADGRSNRPNVGRHSLGTDDRAEARRLVAELDLVMAVKHGMAEAPAPTPAPQRLLPLDRGRELYMDYVGRSRVAGGVRPSTQKRYRTVFDKFFAFGTDRGLNSWNQVTSQTLQQYAKHLETREYAYRSLYLELTTLKQVILWLVKEKHLPPESRIELALIKPEGTQTYCWRPNEVRAMIDHCRHCPALRWLGGVILALATTGLRISELAALRWSDIDLVRGMIRLADETSSSRCGSGSGPARTLKSGRSRSFPIQDELLPVLQGMDQLDDGFVFHGPRGGRLKPDRARLALIQEVLNPLSANFPSTAGEVGFVDGRLHSFRHFFCSLCANRNVPQRVVMNWLGHTESRMVGHYYHLQDDEARRQMSRIRLYDQEAGGGAVGA